MERTPAEGGSRGVSRYGPITVDPHISWDFWLLGNTYDDYVTRKLNTPGNPHGCALVAPKFRVHVRSWAEVLGEAKHRHKYIERALAATSDEDSGLTYLNRVHQDLLPDVVKRDE